MDYKDMLRESFGFFQTLLVELKKLSTNLDSPRFSIKSDDSTGLALADNKNSKMGIILGDALVQGERSHA